MCLDKKEPPLCGAILATVLLALCLASIVRADAPTPFKSLAKMPVKEVTVFKDGHAFVLHEGKMPTDAAGNVVMDYLPAPVLGTFWPYSAEKSAKLTGGRRRPAQGAGRAHRADAARADRGQRRRGGDRHRGARRRARQPAGLSRPRSSACPTRSGRGAGGHQPAQHRREAAEEGQPRPAQDRRGHQGRRHRPHPGRHLQGRAQAQGRAARSSATC